MITGYDEATTRTLNQTGAIRGVRVIAQGDSWAVEVQAGGEWVPMVSARGHVRTWRSLDRLTLWLHGDIGVGAWTVDAEKFEPSQRRAAV